MRPNSCRCMRCGGNYDEIHYCKAFSRKCYRCRKYGHYANLCSNSNISKCFGSKIPSGLKTLEEDVLEESSYLCGLMPFASVADKDLNFIYFNSNTRIISEKNHSRRKLVKPKKIVSVRKDEKKPIGKESDHYQSKIQELVNSLSELKQRYDQEQTQHEQIEENSFLMCLSDIENLSTFISDLFLMINPKKLSWQRLSLYEDQKFTCDKCGSKKFHFDEHCAAIKVDNPCKFCNEKGHLTVFCPNTNQLA